MKRFIAEILVLWTLIVGALAYCSILWDVFYWSFGKQRYSNGT